jgi:hypothetical protein
MSTETTVKPALRALLSECIDYAGIYPPAALPLRKAVKNFQAYESQPYAWMLSRLVVGTAELCEISPAMDGKLSVLSDSDEQRAGAIESKTILQAPSKPVYCEVTLEQLGEQLDTIKKAGLFAKIRTGGIKPEAIPSPAKVAAFISACSRRRLAFKATAGLHHPIRSEYPLTYAPDAPRATMHGFINLLMAAALAWYGKADPDKVLSETDPDAFSFGEAAHWRDTSLDANQLATARKDFIHSIGSCSFEEPVKELKALGWLD